MQIDEIISNRFDQALQALQIGEEIFEKQTLLETFYIPGTNMIINQNKIDVCNTLIFRNKILIGLIISYYIFF